MLLFFLFLWGFFYIRSKKKGRAREKNILI